MIVMNELTTKELNLSIRTLENIITTTKNMVQKSKNEIMAERLYKKLNQHRHRLTMYFSERNQRKNAKVIHV
jgi:hypothetical protein